MKKILATVVLGASLTTSHLSAQDDVSIMDLKETVYLLMKDVQKMKKEQEKALTETSKISHDNEYLVEAMADEVKDIKRDTEVIKATDVLPSYKVNEALLKYNNK